MLRNDLRGATCRFLARKRWPDKYRARIEKLKADEPIEMHDSGAFFRFTDNGARRFA
jgi:hypothetical protein